MPLKPLQQIKDELEKKDTIINKRYCCHSEIRNALWELQDIGQKLRDLGIPAGFTVIKTAAFIESVLKELQGAESEEINKEFKGLTDKIKEVLGEEIKEVKVSTRLTTSPSCVLKDTSDPMASMAHMFASMGQQAPEIPLVLEINPDHEMIKKLDGVDDESLFADIAWILLDNAKLAEGLELKDKGAFAARISSIAAKAL